ncbi:uncharacterized protein KQ657_002965 [Scheffersomyces spartinae]|uniref:Uncharacterized protein n=1 Tax=Scheffersomyces spartinae TaxID=45513 RepID=A0A9P7V560_9ASCO|nr:uncharacterized protein KQ657_002965 [Scheffersomyces spartinae]KAG7191572.1 hypothetical protein KQ657_002965 [Scheffersomyces spartinae]
MMMSDIDVVTAGTWTATTVSSTTTAAGAVKTASVGNSIHSASTNSSLATATMMDSDNVHYTSIHENGAVFRQFEDLGDFFRSTLYKEIRKGKQKTQLGIHLKKKNVAYLFDPAANDFQSDGSWWSSPSNNNVPINFLEVDYGKANSQTVYDFPISLCALSIHGEGGTYEMSNTLTRGLHVNIGPSFGATLVLLSSRMQGGIGGVSTDLSTSGGISCELPKQGKLQVFVDLPFVSFPEARKRDVVILNKKIDSQGKWSKLKPTVQERSSLGTLLFNLAEFPTPKCVDDPAKLQCSANKSVVGNAYEAAKRLT